MKKIYTLLVFSFLAGQVVLAGGGCTIDTSNQQFFSPRPDSLPCIERTVGYNETIQIAVPMSIDLQQFGFPFPFVLTVDSLVIDSVSGLPNGIFYSPNPANGHVYGGDHACALIYGTTADSTGNYPVDFYGKMTLRGSPFPPFFDGDTTVNLADLQGAPQNPFRAFVDVINPGDSCIHPAFLGISDFNSSLNSILSVYPNPNNGIFELKLNTERKTEGEIEILDILGRIIFSRKLYSTGIYSVTIDLSEFNGGLYTVRLRTEEGFASKSISVE